MITANTPRAVLVDTTHAPLRYGQRAQRCCPPCNQDCAQGRLCPALKLTEADLDARELERSTTIPMDLDDEHDAQVSADNRWLGRLLVGLFAAIVTIAALAALLQEINP